MQVYSLEIEDFSDNNYTLIGIHSTLEDYKLAYVLNSTLNTKFKKANFSLDFENKNNNASFSIYEFENKKQYTNWFLISNTYKDLSRPVASGLFIESEITTYLIPELKKVDFFLKLEGDFEYDFILKTIEKINQTKQIITSYKIDANTLKSKDFLIF
ncbi:MAG: IPExxxVDY family protein [Flavobacteriaceae bacterium]